MRGHQAKDPHGKNTYIPAVIKPKFAATTTSPVLKRPSCELSWAKKWNPKVVKQEANKEKEAIFAWEKYQAGNFNSMYQFMIKTRGQKSKGYDREAINDKYRVGKF